MTVVRFPAEPALHHVIKNACLPHRHASQITWPTHGSDCCGPRARTNYYVIPVSLFLFLVIL